MAKRTTAQRRKAAKESWARRKAGLGPLYRRKGKKKVARTHTASDIEVQAALPPAFTMVPEVRYMPAPRIAYAVREGDDIFVCFGQDGSLNRERVDESVARKLLRDLTAILI